MSDAIPYCPRLAERLERGWNALGTMNHAPERSERSFTSLFLRVGSTLCSHPSSHVIIGRQMYQFLVFVCLLRGVAAPSCIPGLNNLSGQSNAAPAEPVKRPVIVAHYMPWFEANPASRQWGWHWRMNAFDPEQRTDGKRSIASHYYPLIGPYDSGDPAVIEYHLLLMKLAGIDGIVVDWYGLSDFLDYPVIHRNTRALFESAAKIGLRIGICYEDQTITKQVEAKRLAAGDRVPYAEREMEWLRENWFSKPVYLRLNGKPVLLSFGSSGLSDDEWAQVFRSTADAPIYLSE